MAPRLAEPTAEERAAARAAAASLRAAIADPSTMGERSVAHIDLTRPRRGEWWVSWANLPGFTAIDCSRFTHTLLPGWEYSRDEVRRELIPDLERLAEQGVRPTEATR